MNQKNYFFLICLVISNSQFAMENSDVYNFTNACKQIKGAFEGNNVPSLVEPLDFFSDFNDKPINPSVQKVMNGVSSPLLDSIKAIASLKTQIDNFVYFESAVSILPDIGETRACQNTTRYQNLVQDKNQQFQVLKILCNQFPFFFSNLWNMQGMTPLIYACSCEANMEDEVRLLLAHNADPQHVLHADNVPYKTALEAAAALKHESIVAILANAETENNQHSDEPVTRGSFFTTLLTKKQLEQDRQKVVHAIELSDILQFKKMIKNENINVDDLYHNEKYGSISFLAIALNQYFLQKELFHNIVPQNENTSQTLKNWVFVGYEAAKTILFDLVEKKPNLNIGYTHPVTNELVRGEKVLSTPLKEAIKRNDLSLMLHLVANGADLNYKGESDEAITPIELAQQSSHPDLLNVILKISREEDVVPLEGRDKGSQEKDQDEELTE